MLKQRKSIESDIGQKKIRDFSLDKDDKDPLEDEDIFKIDRLQLINASARYQLLSANKQLIEFHLGRIMERRKKQKQTDGPTEKQKPRRVSSSYSQNTLKEKEQNTIASQELGTKLKTIKEEYM